MGKRSAPPLPAQRLSLGYKNRSILMLTQSGVVLKKTKVDNAALERGRATLCPPSQPANYREPFWFFTQSLRLATKRRARYSQNAPFGSKPIGYGLVWHQDSINHVNHTVGLVDIGD